MYGLINLYINCSEVKVLVLIGDTHFMRNWKIVKIISCRERDHKGM